MRTMPSPKPMQVVPRPSVPPTPVTSPPPDSAAASGLTGLVNLCGHSSLSNLSGMSGLWKLEAEVSRHGIRDDGMRIGVLIEEHDDELPEGKLLTRLPKLRGVPWAGARHADAGMRLELRRLIDRMRRDGVSLANVAMRLRGWACAQRDVEQIALGHTGARYVVAVGLSSLTPDRFIGVYRSMEIARMRFNAHEPSIVILGPNDRRSPHLTAPDTYRVWPA